MNKLLAKFTVVHAHECNHFPLRKYGDYVLPEITEVTFVRKDLVSPITCINPPYIHGLDFPEKKNEPDHAHAFVLPDAA